MQAGSNGSISMRPASISVADIAVGQDHRRADATRRSRPRPSGRVSSAASPSSIARAAVAIPSASGREPRHLERGARVEQHHVALRARSPRRGPRVRDPRLGRRRRPQILGLAPRRGRAAGVQVRLADRAVLHVEDRRTGRSSSARRGRPRPGTASRASRGGPEPRPSAAASARRRRRRPARTGRAGFVSGPRKLNTVGTRSSARTGAAWRHRRMEAPART